MRQRTLDAPWPRMTRSVQVTVTESNHPREPRPVECRPLWGCGAPRLRRPAHRRGARLLGARRHVGRLQPGQKLPTIRELAEQYESSDAPVKQALRVLEATGVIETQQGKGTYVAHR